MMHIDSISNPKVTQTFGNITRKVLIPTWRNCLITLIVIFIYSLLVYVIPTAVGVDFEGAYDAFAYAQLIFQNSEVARELQPFLNAYPSGIFSQSTLPFYSIFLHLSIMLVPLLILYKTLRARTFGVILTALSIPESALFLGAISKEGLAIAAVLAVICGQVLYFKGSRSAALFVTIYAIVIAEFSRPYFGIPFTVAILGGYFPSLSSRVKFIVSVGICFIISVTFWVLLVGPLKIKFAELYTDTRVFLNWFEENLGSASAVKTAVRYFFSSVFSSDQPTLFFLFLAAIMAVIKTLVYLLAFPLVSLPDSTNLAAFTWALTWQVATSWSSILIVYFFVKIRKMKVQLTIEDQCRIWFGLSLLFVIAASTAFFHVRYRAPAMVALVIACFMIKNPSHRLLAIMTSSTILVACYALLF